jgi:hypothetical protein
MGYGRFVASSIFTAISLKMEEEDPTKHCDPTAPP